MPQAPKLKKVSRELTKKTLEDIEIKKSVAKVREKCRCQVCKCPIYLDYHREYEEKYQLCQVCKELLEDE